MSDYPSDLQKRRQSVNTAFNQPVISEETKNKIKNFFGGGDNSPEPNNDAYSEALKRKKQSYESKD